MDRRDRYWTTAASAVLMALGSVACASAPPAPADSPVVVENPPGVSASAPSHVAGTTEATSVAMQQTVQPVAGAQVTAVALETGSSSAVIRVANDPTYAVERVVYFDGPEPGPSHRLDGTTLVLDGCHLEECYYAYTVTVPAGAVVTGEASSGATTIEGAAQVDLDSGSGTVNLADIAGPIRITSGSGPVTLDNVRGNVVVGTGSGPVEGQALAGTTTVVESGSGPIDLTFATVQTISATSGSGSVNLAVAPGRYRVVSEHDPAKTEVVGVASDPGADTAVFVGPGSGRVKVTAGA